MLARFGLCILVAALLLAVRAEGAPAPASAAAEPGLLAFETLTGGIFTIRADGSGNREIVPGGHSPTWSPDGTRLLYERDNGFGGLWSALADGTDARLIMDTHLDWGLPRTCNTEWGASDGAWSPSGRRVAFVGLSEDVHERSVQVICTAALDGSGERVLRHGTEPDWIPGRRRIAFIAAAKSRQSFSAELPRCVATVATSACCSMTPRDTGAVLTSRQTDARSRSRRRRTVPARRRAPYAS